MNIPKEEISYINCNNNKCTIFFTNLVHINSKQKKKLKDMDKYTKVVCDNNKCEEIQAKIKYVGNSKSGFFCSKKLNTVNVFNKNTPRYNDYINMIKKADHVVETVENDYIKHTIHFKKMENLTTGVDTKIVSCHDGCGCTEMNLKKEYIKGFSSSSWETAEFYNIIVSYNIFNSKNSD